MRGGSEWIKKIAALEEHVWSVGGWLVIWLVALSASICIVIITDGLRNHGTTTITFTSLPLQVRKK